MKLNLGCGDNLIQGFYNVDKYDQAADFVCAIQDLEFESDSIEEIVMYQVLEHTLWHELTEIMDNCYRMLAPGGKITIEVPDMEVIAKGILEDGMTREWQDNIYGGYHRPWDVNRYPDALFHQGSVHYQGFTFAKLHDALYDAGFGMIHKNSMAEKHPNYKYEENLSVTAIK